METEEKNKQKIICSVCHQPIPEDKDWILTPMGYKCADCWEKTTERVFR